MKINVALVECGDIESLVRSAYSRGEIFLANENSMVNTRRIDDFEGGKLGPQSVNLDTLKGNERVLWALEKFLELDRGIYFPGTLIEDRNGYFMVTMPIIAEGKLVGRRRKIIAAPYVDDWVQAANLLLGPKKAEEIRDAERKLGRIFYLEPYKSVYEAAKRRTIEEAAESVKSYGIGSHNVLPVICNEMPSISKYYSGKPASLILHSCSNFFGSEGEMLGFYEKVAKELSCAGIVENTFYIAVAEGGSNPVSGVYKIGGQLKIQPSRGEI